jgi:subtilisin family serine protease
MLSNRLFRAALVVSLVTLHLTSFSQKLLANWQNLDLSKDSVYGVGTNRAYEELLKGKTSTSVIVAVIDDGTDINHEDLKAHIWKNKNEKMGNSVDDDKNGYIDDVNGWNFLGNKIQSYEIDNYEVTRLVRTYQSFFKYPSDIKNNPDEYTNYQKALSIYESRKKEYETIDKRLNSSLAYFESLQKKLNRDSLTIKDLQETPSADSLITITTTRLITNLQRGIAYSKAIADMKKMIESNKSHLQYHINLQYDPRLLVGDDDANINDRNYGNRTVVSEGDHGTHVSGIIGAVRNNDKGIDGIADNVQLMILRVVPNGDERDKDIALAIRYAVDNGARVINMSFGKPLSYKKEFIDDAVQYAISKNVLLVHAAGNESLDLDVEQRFPNPNYKKTKGNAWKNWIDVGASNGDGNPGTFSNYGKKYVDLFAPGVKINSTILNNEYAPKNGTSMAAPVVAGVAALIISYYPSITAPQLKVLLMKTVYKPTQQVKKPGAPDTTVLYSDLCKSAGIVNVYNALKLADKKYGK